MPKILAATAVLALMIALGASDALLIEGGLPNPVLPDEPYAQTEPTVSSQPTQTPQPSQPTQPSSVEGGSSSATAGVKKAMGPDVLLTLTRLGFEI